MDMIIRIQSHLVDPKPVADNYHRLHARRRHGTEFADKQPEQKNNGNFLLNIKKRHLTLFIVIVKMVSIYRIPIPGYHLM